MKNSSGAIPTFRADMCLAASMGERIELTFLLLGTPIVRVNVVDQDFDQFVQSIQVVSELAQFEASKRKRKSTGH